MMTVQQLECFAETARTLSFARAAEILNVTQPSVSRQIGSLEKELGVRLFARTTRHVSLTPEGELFFTDVKDILNRMKAAMLHVRHEDAENVQILRIGCCDTNDMDVLGY